MNKAKRRVVIAGNWKMNKNRAEAKALITELLPLVKEAGCEVVLCTPYTNLETALALTEGSNVKVGAENCHWAESGAFTGEISAQMLKELGCSMSSSDTASAGSTLARPMRRWPSGCARRWKAAWRLFCA